MTTQIKPRPLEENASYTRFGHNSFEIEGKQALFVVNLPKRKMAGKLSQGMLLDVSYADKQTPCLLMPEVDMPNGCRAG